MVCNVRCMACNNESTVYLADIGKWMELHRRVNKDHRNYHVTHVDVI